MALKGQLQDLSVSDLVKIHCIGRARACVRLTHNSGNAEIYFDNGNIIDARFDALGGVDAVKKALSLAEGKYQVELNSMSAQRTIERPWNEILKEWEQP
jgi:hypothetical protein